MFKTGFIKLNKNNTNLEAKTPIASNNDRGVVYLGHVPHGFYEKEMIHYFSQFGEVTNINIPKSKKTGRARGFAFVEFMYPEVAKVVAETMNNYLMDKKIIVARYLSPNQVKSNAFSRSNKNKIPLTIKNRSMQRKKAEKLLSPQKEIKCQLLLNNHLEKLQKKLKTKGIEYEIQTFNPKLSTNKISRNILKNKGDDDNLSDTHSKHSVTMIISDNEEEIPNKIISKLIKKKKKNQ